MAQQRLTVVPAKIDEFALTTLLSLRGRQSARSSALRLSLSEYVRQAWPVIEPASPLVANWHIDAICEHLEAVSRGDIERLVINVPPGSAKSLLCAVLWPTWEWTWRPEGRWLCNSYAAALSIRDALRSRRLIQSRWYQERWGSVVQLTSDQYAKVRYDNDRSGYRIASSVTGANTGERADRLLVDDPHNVAEAESALDRETAVRFLTEVLPSRGNDPRHTPIVLIQQRVHQEDCAGSVLARGGWHLLRIPLEWEPHLSVDLADAYQAGHDAVVDRSPVLCPLPTRDPRTAEGDLFDANRYDQGAVRKLQLDLGAYAYAGQYQQHPVPRSGAVLDPAWWQPVPADLRGTIVQYWDTAFSERQTADYTAAATVEMDGRDRMVLRHVWRQRVADGALDARMADEVQAQRASLVYVEEAAYRQASVRTLVDRVGTLLRQRGYACAIQSVAVKGDKVVRAQIQGTYGRAGLLFADQGAGWWPAVAAEMAAFPLGAHDDQVDAISGALTAAITHVAGARGLKALLGQSAPMRLGDPAPAPGTAGNDALNMLLGAR